MKIKRFQEGGSVDPAMAPEAAQTAPEQGAQQDPLMQIAEMFAQGLQAQDCQLLAQGAEMFLQLISQAQGAGAPQGEPVFKKGGKIARRA